MSQKRKASKACIGNLQSTRETASGKWRRSTPAESNLSDRDEGRTSDDEIVHLKFLNSNQNWYTISQMDNDSGQDIPDVHPAIQVTEQTNATANASEAGTFNQNQSHFQVELKAVILPSTSVRELCGLQIICLTRSNEILPSLSLDCHCLRVWPSEGNSSKSSTLISTKLLRNVDIKVLKNY